MLLKCWWNAFISSIKEYIETGEIVLDEGWEYSDRTTGKFGWFSFFIVAMLIVLPFAIIGNIIQMPIYLIGKITLKIYKLLERD